MARPSLGPVAAPRPARPRLLILTVGFGVGGAEQLILTTAPRLQRRGFEVTVACLKGWDILGDELDARGVRAVALGASGRFDVRAAGRLLSLLRGSRIQILHSHVFLANVAARLVGRLAGVPVIITAHHDTDVWMGLRHRALEWATAPLSDAVVACSEAVRQYALRSYGLSRSLVRTLHNGIEIPEDRLPNPQERERTRRELGAGPAELLIGTIGRLLEPKKGMSVFLAAAGRIARDRPEARFAVVGDGPSRGFLEECAGRAGISHRTMFTGQRRDVASILPAFDLFVLSSFWEGFGITLIEAMSHRVPVVATRVGGVPEVVVDGETGLLVPPGDPEALARACLVLLGDQERSARMAAAGRARAEALFGIDRLVEETAGLYHELLSQARGAADSPRLRRRVG